MFAALIEEWDRHLASGDPLEFPGYRAKLDTLDRESVRTGLADGFVLVEGDFSVIGGSMGLVHGEKVVRAFDRAVERNLPVVVVTRSGGARMQEGMLSLVQMARTSAAVQRHRGAGLLSVAVLRSPTTGGVFASYGSLTDLRVAEAGATVGFAGPRVVSATEGIDVEGHSHDAATAWRAGLVDDVVEADQLAGWVGAALGLDDRPLDAAKVAALPEPAPAHEPEATAPPAASPLDAWALVQSARHPSRPSGAQIAVEMVQSWTELESGIDPTVRTGLARVAGRRVVVVACDRHHDRGKPGAAAFRKVQRALKVADQLALPVVSLVDTPGADPRPEAENDGVAGEIARTFAAMADVAVPTLAVCVGEGGSGGALALSAADRLLIQHTAVFSVIGPEGAAAIIERDAAKAPDLAEKLGLTPSELVSLGVVDAVVGDRPTEVAAAVAEWLIDIGPLEGPQRSRARLTRFDRATRRWLTERGDAPA